jgi:hypothetical protein
MSPGLGSLSAEINGAVDALVPHSRKHRDDKPPAFAVIPPRPPVTNGLVVAFAPAAKTGARANRIITSKCALPLTPSTISIQAGGNWTDGIYPVRGDERSQFAGAMLENISFSARLEPPDFYVVANSKYGSKADDNEAAQWGVVPPPPLAGYVLGSYSGAQADNEYAIQKKYFGGAQGVTPPSPGGQGGTVVMQPGAIAPPGYAWHEPHDFCALLEATCNAGEYVRLIIGDQYMVNCIISIRTFTWYYEDADPDVINFDLTARGERIDSRPTQGKPLDGSYSTRAGDTLYKIGAKFAGDPSTNASKIFEYNLHKLRELWIYTDSRATAPTYQVDASGLGDSAGAKVNGKHGHQVGKIRYGNTDGITQFTYLRAGIKLSLSKPKSMGTGHQRSSQPSRG